MLPAGSLDLSGCVCVLCAHPLQPVGEASVECRSGHRFRRIARYAFNGKVRAGGPARSRRIEPEPPAPEPAPVEAVAVLEELREREADMVDRERTLRASRSWREEMLAEIQQERAARRA